MSEWDRCLPPGDRSDEPELGLRTPHPLPGESPSECIRRLAIHVHGMKPDAEPLKSMPREPGIEG